LDNRLKSSTFFFLVELQRNPSHWSHFALVPQLSLRMTPLRFAILGTGFWASFQLGAWRELQGVECVALYNRTRSRGEKFGKQFQIPAVYDDPKDLFEREQLDFVDIITEVPAHKPLVLLAAKYKTPVICQKPMAATLADAEEMVESCRKARVPFFIHENFRWQTPMRALKLALDSGVVGAPFRARVSFVTGFPVFRNQPMLAELEQLIISDLGTHMLDLARFFFGEAESIYCQTRRIHPNIKGEDAATMVLRMKNGVTVDIQIAYVENYIEQDFFPETLVLVEAGKGSLELAPRFWLRTTTRDGTFARRVPPPRYAWADPDYAVVHASGVPLNANLLTALRGQGQAETTGKDNLKTVGLVFAAYESAEKNVVVEV
jgi:predicted dehydrogenase